MDFEKENELLKSKQLHLENIKDNDEKFQFYTNLPIYPVFFQLFVTVLSLELRQQV